MCKEKCNDMSIKHKIHKNRKYVNETVDERLKLDKRTIKRANSYLGDILGSHKKSWFECLACRYQWLTTPHSIFSNGTDCPNCAGNAHLTDAIIDNRLIGRKIKRVGNIINAITKILWQCLEDDCNNIWLARADSVLNNRRGCPNCAGNIKLTNEMVDKKIKEQNRTIKRAGGYLGNIINSKTKSWWECLVDNYLWQATPNSIFNCPNGCPSCAGQIEFTNEMVDKKIKEQNRTIKRMGGELGNIFGAFKKSWWECLIDGNRWLTTASSILNNGTDCPSCNIPGINEALVFNILKENDINFNHEFNIKNISSTATNNYRLDFYMDKYFNKIAIEYNGKQHYTATGFGSMDENKANDALIKQQARDKYIDQFCKDNNITIIWIDGREFTGKKLEKYIIEEIIPQIIKNNK